MLSIVVPCHNEQEVLPELHARLSAVLENIGQTSEIVFVNDGSTDRTLACLEMLRTRDPRVGLVNLSRNFGKEIATTAGLDHARGAAVVVIDADLQDPPEVIPELLAAWRDGADVVHAQRRARAGEPWLKRATAAAFYRVMGRAGRAPIPRNVGDFRLMSRRVVDAMGELREQHRFMKGLFAWVGFPSRVVVYDRAPRHAGRTKWGYWKLWNLAIEAITSHTVMPLKVATYLGLLTAFGAALYLLEVVVRTLVWGNSVAGYPSLMAVVLFLGSAQLVTLGVIGEYLGRVFNETKGRPLYLVERFVLAEGTERRGGIIRSMPSP
ncbi:MAG TPA: glycosyltransferase family 2 protein [Acetobacteraceae bacterium]|nr:glycosyltransferase family 2 protein [Acetobacteraceae bacterium]